ncbi:MAG: hypothetical protein HYV26_04195 [Candidatus Hydrogenedentes bacterium]|nr:hypothetical protein [Candidatus Hydrogenedentota bacterium]
MPRLLIIVHVFNPDRGGGGAIFSDLAYGLTERGFDVTVRCAYPYYPEWQDKSGRNGLRIERYEDQGVHVQRYGIYIPRNPNSLLERLIYEASFFISLLRSLPRGKGFDAVMVYCPLVGAVGFAILNKWCYGRPLWLNVQDLSADAAAASGIARGAAVSRVLKAIQSWCFNQAQVWSSISPVMIARLQQIRRGAQPLLYLPNWLNQSLAQEIAALPDKSGRPPAVPVKLLYAGNIGTKQDLLRFCQALRQSSASFAFRIHGDGGQAGAVRAWVESTGDARFTFAGFLEEPALAQALHEADFFVITEKSGSGGSFIPCKTISGLASGTPILAVADAESPLGQEMEMAAPGPCFAWNELEKVPALLAAIHQTPELFQQWQANARARAYFYGRDGVIDRFAGALRALVTANNQPLEQVLSAYNE